MKNDTQQIDSDTDNSQQTSEKLAVTDKQMKQKAQDQSQLNHKNNDFTDNNAQADNQQKSAKSEVYHLKPNASFKVEETPQMEVGHLDKADAAPIISSTSVANTPNSNWNVEKTILINDDENVSASFVHMDTKQRFGLETFPFYIGRTPDCNLQLEDMSLSRQHAKIEKTESGMTVEDLDSANGIKVNDISIDQVLLMEGDILTLGHVNLRFEISDTAQSKSKEKTNEFLDRINLTHPNWKKYAAFGLVGTVLAGSFFYKSDVDDRVTVTQIPNVAKPKQQAAAVDIAEKKKTVEPSAISQEAADAGKANPSPASSINSKRTQTNPAENANEANKETSVAKTTTAPKKPSTIEKHPVKSENKKNGRKNKPTQEQEVTVPEIANTIATPNPENVTRSSSSSISDLVEDETNPIDKVENKSNKNNRKKESKSKSNTAVSVKASIKPKPSLARRQSITKARRLYMNGSVDQAIRVLDKLSINPRVSTKIQLKSFLLHREIVKLNKHYQQGLQMYRSGDKKRAWVIWEAFIVEEKKLKMAAQSEFAKTIKRRVKEASQSRIQTPEATKVKVEPIVRVNPIDKQQASPDNTVASPRANPRSFATSETEIKARKLYRDGYRQEHANLSKAIERWREVIKLAAPNSEYYTKAKAKLRFYEEMMP